MSDDLKKFTYTEISEHSSKKDLFVVIHDKVYNASSFVDEHPGGEEVLLDVGGQDATEAFEDVGHSDEAREILEKLLIGELKRVPGDPPKPAPEPGPSSPGQSSDGGVSNWLYALVLLGAVSAFGAYRYLQATGQAEGK